MRDLFPGRTSELFVQPATVNPGVAHDEEQRPLGSFRHHAPGTAWLPPRNFRAAISYSCGQTSATSLASLQRQFRYYVALVAGAGVSSQIELYTEACPEPGARQADTEHGSVRCCLVLNDERSE